MVKQLTNGFPRIQRLKPLWSSICLSPSTLFTNVMEKRDYVP